MSAESPNYAYAEAVRLRELGIRSAAVNMGMRRIIGSKSERAGGLARSQTRRDVAEQLERMNADFADCVAETVDRFEGG